MSDPIDPSPSSSAFWLPAATLSRSGKKVRADAVLKNLSAAAQALIVEWCKKPMDRDEDGKPIKGTGGVEYALDQLSSVAVSCALPALAVSHDTLYKFLQWYQLEQDLDTCTEVQEQVLARTGDKQKARETAEMVLLRLGIARQDAKLITAATMAEDSRRNLDLQEVSGKTKAAQKDRQLNQKDRDFALAREKFVTESCEKIMLAARDPKTREIVEDSKLTNAEKIAAIREKYFADIDAVKVELPE